MSHFSVLVIGSGDLNTRLDPFWELDLPDEDARHDPRSAFEERYTRETAEEERLSTIETIFLMSVKKPTAITTIPMLNGIGTK